MTRRNTHIIATAVLAAAFAGNAAAAEAKSDPEYELSVRGSQVTTWTYSHDPEFECDATIRGNGSQSITYGTRKPIRVKVVKSPSGPLLARLDDNYASFGTPMPLDVPVTASREGTEQTIAAPGGECNGTGGGGHAPEQDCAGERHGVLALFVGWFPWQSGPKIRKDHVQVAGHYADFHRGPATPGRARGEGLQLSQTYDNCPFFSLNHASPAMNALEPTAGKLPTKRVLALKRGRTLKHSDDQRNTSGDGERASETLNAVNIKLKRVK